MEAEEITAHLDYYKALHKELVSSGELVESQVLAGPDLAKIVTSDGLAAPVVTDGPFQEFKEWVAGYQIVDVESEARAIEIAAALHWPRDGVPEEPRGWLVQTAVRRLIDQKRSEQSRRDRESLAMLQDAAVGNVPDQDDTLILLFMCCHPALTPASAIALTLRAVGALTTAQIASAFLVGEATMAQRISRAKQRIKASGVPFGMPTPKERAARVRTVLHVLYLVFNEGYASSGGYQLHRTELSDEAIRLTRMLQRLLPDDGEVTGLLALMLLIDARRPARTNSSGELITLAEQDRTKWDQEVIAEGVALLNSAIGKGSVGEYQLQAAIAAVHDQARRADDTDWPQILALYGLLEQMTRNPIVTINKAVAAAMVDGPSAGLALLDEVEEQLRRPLPAGCGPRSPVGDGR